MKIYWHYSVKQWLTLPITINSWNYLTLPFEFFQSFDFWFFAPLDFNRNFHFEIFVLKFILKLKENWLWSFYYESRTLVTRSLLPHIRALGAKSYQPSKFYDLIFLKKRLFISTFADNFWTPWIRTKL